MTNPTELFLLPDEAVVPLVTFSPRLGKEYDNLEFDLVTYGQWLQNSCGLTPEQVQRLPVHYTPYSDNARNVFEHSTLATANLDSKSIEIRIRGSDLDPDNSLAHESQHIADFSHNIPLSWTDSRWVNLALFAGLLTSSSLPIVGMLQTPPNPELIIGGLVGIISTYIGIISTYWLSPLEIRARITAKQPRPLFLIATPRKTKISNA